MRVTCLGRHGPLAGVERKLERCDQRGVEGRSSAERDLRRDSMAPQWTQAALASAETERRVLLSDFGWNVRDARWELAGRRALRLRLAEAAVSVEAEQSFGRAREQAGGAKGKTSGGGKGCSRMGGKQEREESARRVLE